MIRLASIAAAGLIALGGHAVAEEPAIITCLNVPILGDSDGHSSCLTQAQLQRRNLVVECFYTNERPVGHINQTLVLTDYVIRGGSAMINAMAEKGMERMATAGKDEAVLTSKYACMSVKDHDLKAVHLD